MYQIRDLETQKEKLEDALWNHMEKQQQQYQRVVDEYDGEAEEAEAEEK